MKQLTRPEGHRFDDAGLTLPELLISIVILGVIVVALANAFIASVHNNQATADRLNQSNDAQLVANYIVRDAQSTDGTGVSTTDASTCGASGSPMIRLSWFPLENADQSNGTQKNVNYVKTGNTVTRWSCSGSAAPWSAVSKSTVASDILTASISCTGGNATCGASSTSTGLQVLVTEVQGSSNAYNFTLNATFRKSIGTKPTPPVPNFSSLALIVLGDGSGTTTPCLDFGGSSTIDITVSGAAGLNCYGSQTGAAQVNGTYYSTNTCVTCVTDPNTHWYAGSAPISDPYLSRSYPDPYSGFAAGTDANGDIASCNGATLVAGKYRNITIDNNNTCTLASGTFVVTGCINAKNGATLQNTGGVLISFKGTTTCSDGSLLMVGNSSTKLSLPSLSTTTWPEFSMIMPRTNTSTISFQGQSGTCVSGLYFPAGTLQLGGGSGAKFGKLVVARIQNNGNVSYNIGGTCP